MAYMDKLLITHGGINADGTFNYFTATSTSAMGNVIDLQANRDIGEGADVYLRAFFKTPYSTPSSSSFMLLAHVADTPNMSPLPAGNLVCVGSSGTVNYSSIDGINKAGYFAIKLRPHIASLGKRYLSAEVNSSPSMLVLVDFALEIGDAMKQYPSGFEV